MKIVAFTGYKQSGKTTATEYLEGKVESRGLSSYRGSFAKPLKKVAKMIYPKVDFEAKEVPQESVGGKTPRQILQILGTDIARTIYPNTWVDLARLEIEENWKTDFIFYDDVRFVNEEFILVSMQLQSHFPVTFYMISVERPGHNPELQGETHVSELEIAEVKKYATYQISNDGDMTDYEEKLDELWETINER